MRVTARCLSLLVLLGVSSLRAQSSLAVGATGGAVKLTAQRSQQALTGIVQYQTGSWLSLSATPSFLHVSDVVSGKTASSFGTGDLPLSAAASHGFATTGSPVIAGVLTVVLPTGNAACGLGSGETSFGLDLGAGASPGEHLHIAADASRGLGGLSAQSALSAPRATSLRGEASYDLSPRWTTSVSLGVDVGQSDSTQALSRSLGAGLTHPLAGPLTLTLDGSVGLSAASPKWALSVGIGSVFAGTSPVSLSSPLRRLKSTFVGGASRGGGAGKVGCR